MTPQRPTQYTAELGQLICDKIAESNVGLVKLCLDNDAFPHHTTIFRWLADADKKDFLQNYLRARDAQADLLSDEIIEIADTSGIEKDGPTHVARARLRIDARKWKAAKLAPKKYAGEEESEEEPSGNVVWWGGKELPI